jgi:ubiquitin C-terminal hydrolase
MHPKTPQYIKTNFFMRIAPAIWHLVFEHAMERQDKIKFTPGQECVREGFHLFLESLEGLDDLQNLFLHRYQTLIFCGVCNEWVVDKKCEFSLFEVQPDLKSPQLPRFQGIDPHYKKSRPLSEYLVKQNNYLEKGFRCPKCGDEDYKFQTTRLMMIPEILVVLAKKYDAKGLQKSQKITNFTKDLVFQKKKTDEDTDEDLHYTAVARVEHLGHMNGGHYKCHGLRKDKNWHLLNDSQVSPGSFESTSDTYMVFYHVV